MNPIYNMTSNCLNSPFHQQEKILDFLIANYFDCHWNSDLVCTIGNFRFKLLVGLNPLPILTVSNLKRTDFLLVIGFSVKVLRLAEIIFSNMRSYEEIQMLEEICDFLERN